MAERAGKQRKHGSSAGSGAGILSAPALLHFPDTQPALHPTPHALAVVKVPSLLASPCHALPFLSLQFALVFAYAAAYLFLLHRAFVDHSQLSFSHYRLTNCYIRIMVGGCMEAQWWHSAV